MLLHEQSAKVSASVQPAWQISLRMRSVSLERGCCEPVQRTGAATRGIFSKPKATATSSIRSQACMMSVRVMGTFATIRVPSALSEAGTIILPSSLGISDAGSWAAVRPTAFCT